MSPASFAPDLGAASHQAARSLHSSGVKLDRLSAFCAQAVLLLFPRLVHFNGRLVLVGDGVKAPKRGRKFRRIAPASRSQSITSPSTSSGFPCGCRLARTRRPSVFSVPLAVRIHEGLVSFHRDSAPCSTRCSACSYPGHQGPVLFVTDAYYAAGKMVNDF